MTAERVSIRLMTPADIDAASRLAGQFDADLLDEARECFETDVNNQADWPNQRYRVVAEINGIVVGTMGFTRGPLPADGIRWADWLFVDTGYRRRGVASRLFTAVEDQMIRAGCHRSYLDVGTLRNQLEALCLHLKQGYEIEAVLREYWGPGSDLVIMSKQLSPAVTEDGAGD